jgi:hypothetical protein
MVNIYLLQTLGGVLGGFATNLIRKKSEHREQFWQVFDIAIGFIKGYWFSQEVIEYCAKIHLALKNNALQIRAF